MKTSFKIIIICVAALTLWGCDTIKSLHSQYESQATIPADVFGAGANGNRALAMGVVGGMTVGTIALLFVVPAFFIVFQKLHEKFQGTAKAEIKD